MAVKHGPRDGVMGVSPDGRDMYVAKELGIITTNQLEIVVNLASMDDQLLNPQQARALSILNRSIAIGQVQITSNGFSINSDYKRPVITPTWCGSWGGKAGT